MFMRSVCSNSAEKPRRKIGCSRCQSAYHLNCVYLFKGDADFLTMQNQIWTCPNCTVNRMKTMSELDSSTKEGRAITYIIALLDETSADRKRIEAETKKTFFFVHAKVDDQSTVLKSLNDTFTQL